MGAWCEAEGYPLAFGLFDGRSVFANTTKQPNTLWFSQSNDLLNFKLNSWVEGVSEVEDNNAITVTLNATQIEPIYWLSGQRKLVVGTAGGQWVVESSGAVVTPSDISAKQHTEASAGNLAAIRVNEVTLFADRSQREISDIGFRFDDDAFVATDLTILADHIFRSKIEGMAYQRRPLSNAWCRRADGRISVLSYNRQHNVLGWAPQILGGSFGAGDAVVESVAVIPGAVVAGGRLFDSDERGEVWAIVKRTVNGGTVRYIEVFEGNFEGPLREDYTTEALWRTAVIAAQKDAVYSDSAVVYDGSAITAVTGYDHLEGETVEVLADGIPIGTKTVASAGFTLSTAASKITGGLAYTHKYESLKMAVGAQQGTSVNKRKVVSHVGLILLDSGKFSVTSVSYDDQDGRREKGLYETTFDNTAVSGTTPVFSGETEPIALEGVWSSDERIYVQGSAPLPFTILGLAPRIDTKER